MQDKEQHKTPASQRNDQDIQPAGVAAESGEERTLASKAVIKVPEDAIPTGNVRVQVYTVADATMHESQECNQTNSTPGSI